MYEQSLAAYCKPLDLSRPIYAPRCLAVLSAWPFHDFFRDYMCQLVYRLQQGTARLPLERYERQASATSCNVCR